VSATVKSGRDTEQKRTKSTGAARRTRTVRTKGGLSLRLEPRALWASGLLLALAPAAGVALIGSGDYPMTPPEEIGRAHV